uniref:Uncharacterized protein n=1 Tax=Anguilla anguilla TaxID=7936 RepID=A0A0E9TN16_ANGAN
MTRRISITTIRLLLLTSSVKVCCC